MCIIAYACEVLRSGVGLLDSSLLFTAPGPVQNLTVSFMSESATYNNVNRTYYLPVSISWQPPQYPNGIIVMYNYSLVETNGAGKVVIAGNTTDTELSVERNVTVSPFTNYTATVVAFTNVGSGDSVMEIVLSPEAGKLILCVFVCIPSILYLLDQTLRLLFISSHNFVRLLFESGY